jgi:hypothetical protein
MHGGFFELSNVSFTIFTGDILSHDNDDQASPERGNAETMTNLDRYLANTPSTKRLLPIKHSRPSWATSQFTRRWGIMTRFQKLGTVGLLTSPPVKKTNRRASSKFFESRRVNSSRYECIRVELRASLLALGELGLAQQYRAAVRFDTLWRLRTHYRSRPTYHQHQYGLLVYRQYFQLLERHQSRHLWRAGMACVRAFRM